MVINEVRLPVEYISIASMLTGLYYGYGGIPKEWLNEIVRRDYVEGLCDGLHESLNNPIN